MSSSSRGNSQERIFLFGLFAMLLLPVVLGSAGNIQRRRISRQAFAGCRGRMPESGPSLRVFLTISPRASTSDTGRITERQLELNWKGAEARTGDWIGLFSHDPTGSSDRGGSGLTGPSSPLDKIDIGGRSEGFYRSGVTFPRPTFSRQTLQTECLGFWAAYVRGNLTLSAACLSSRPSWMWDDRQILAGLRLRDLLIPGTHDSGSYEEYQGRSSENVISRYTMCQDENIWNQLAYGNRYLDFRIGHYPATPEKFWLNHGDFKINPIRSALNDLAAFVNSTQEIVIVDFHRFPRGFDNKEVHRDLMNLILQELGSQMLPRIASSDATLNDIWSGTQRIIVAYNDPVFLQNPQFWPGVQHRWGDKNDPKALQIYLDSSMRVPTAELWAAMAQLTPTTADIISNPGGSLRDLADKINRNLTSWTADSWWELANIMATDFFHSTDMVQVAIDANRKRKLCRDRMGVANPFDLRQGFNQRPIQGIPNTQQAFGQPGFSQSGVSQSGFGQSGVGQSGFGQSGVGQSGFGQSGVSQSGFGQSGVGQSGFGQSGVGQSGFGQSGVGQSGFGQSGVGQSGFGQSGVDQSGFGQSGFGQSGFGQSGFGGSGISGQRPNSFGGSSGQGMISGNNVPQQAWGSQNWNANPNPVQPSFSPPPQSSWGSSGWGMQKSQPPPQGWKSSGGMYPPPIPQPIVSGPLPNQQQQWSNRFGTISQYPPPTSWQKSWPQYPPMYPTFAPYPPYLR